MQVIFNTQYKGFIDFGFAQDYFIKYDSGSIASDNQWSYSKDQWDKICNKIKKTQIQQFRFEPIKQILNLLNYEPKYSALWLGSDLINRY